MPPPLGKVTTPEKNSFTIQGPGCLWTIFIIVLIVFIASHGGQLADLFIKFLGG
jgi:hypothetical protein